MARCASSYCQCGQVVYFYKFITLFESFATNRFYTFGNHYAREATAAPERLSAYARHTVGDADACEAGAAIERLITNACHTIWDGDVCEAGTA